MNCYFYAILKMTQRVFAGMFGIFLGSLLCLMEFPGISLSAEPFPGQPLELNGAEIQQWTAGEWEFQAETEFSEKDAFFKVQMDVTFSSENGTVLVMPAFWDGAKTWRVRFTPTELGIWKFTTRVKDALDTGLHAKSGSFRCVPYSGEIELFRRGFVTTRKELKYFVYADGTPFFYLGDTHWGMMREEFDSPGPHAGDLNVEAHFPYLIDRRAEQGFTVIQSEPIGKTINFADGISQSDIDGFKSMDRYFRHIAKRGLVHANAQFFYPSEMLQIQNDDAYLELLTRYWAARYAAYPVFWTLGQEVDDDFYGKFSREANPYVKVCRWLNQYDPYRHPITAHQENTSHTSRTGIGKTNPSIFQDVPGHTWYATQWPLPLSLQVNQAIPRDYWQDGTGKPAILYEGLYAFLWTKDFGARAQGWRAFLSGMFGYGYGAADIWLYQSTYDMNSTSKHDGISVVTPEDKQMKWPEALELPSAKQVGFMKDFLQQRQWWRLVPEFAETTRGVGEPEVTGKMIFSPRNSNVFYCAAHEGKERFLFYFYSRGTQTGTLCELTPGTKFTAEWFDPQCGQLSPGEELTVDSSGKLELPEKENDEDWVLYVKKI